MAPDIESLLDLIKFGLENMYVIKYTHNGTDWYLEQIEFLMSSDIVRKIHWTDETLDALIFNDYDDVQAFAKSQFGPRDIQIVQI